MNKAELVSLIAAKTGETKVKSGEFVEAFIASVTESLKAGEDITLVGFASLSTVARKERKGRNPQTGADLTIPAHTVVKFNAGKDLREAVENFGIPFTVVKVTKDNKAEAYAQIDELMQGNDLLILARYMQILNEDFVTKWPMKIINIHHSFLPAFIGARPYHQAYERGVKIIGATAHYVNDNLDEGPIIMQDVIHVDHTYTAEDMMRAGRDVEKNVLSRALYQVLAQRVFVYGNRTIIL